MQLAVMVGEEEGDGKTKVKKVSVEKAIRALLQIVAKQSSNVNPLFESNSEAMKLLFSLSTIPEKRRVRPWMINLPHPLFDEKSEICFISKTPQKKYKELLLKEHPVPGLTKVIGIEKLRKNYNTLETKRALADTFDLFLCDRDVAEMMPKTLGKVFYTVKRKPPIPVRLKRTDPAPLLQKAINATPLRVPTGPSFAVRIGRCSMSEEQLVANAAAVIPNVLKFFTDNPVQSINVMASNSPALPIWRRPPPPGEPIVMKKYREDVSSSAASETGASRESDSEATHKSGLLSETGDSLSTRDTISEPETNGDLLSELDSNVETPSELGSEVGDAEENVLPTKKAKKRRRGGGVPILAEEPAAEEPSTSMGPPKKIQKVKKTT